jgi:hypothetical protein
MKCILFFKFFIFIFCLLLNDGVFSQIITIEVFETQPYVKWIKTNGIDVLTNPEWVGYKEPGNAIYVFDIDRKTCKLYVGGKLIVDEVVENINIEGDIIKIQSLEPSLENAEAIFETEFEINLKTNESSLTWYNSYADYTRTQKNTKTKISIKKTLEI